MLIMKLKNYIFASLAMAGALCMVSCDDDDTYDVVGNPDNLVYSPQSNYNGVLIQTPFLVQGGLEGKIYLQSTRPASSDIHATFEIDNSLIDAYNEEHGSNYAAIPAEAIVFENEPLIPKGQSNASEPVLVKLTDDTNILSTLDNAGGYLIPVRLTNVTGGGASIAQSVPSVSYLTVDLTDNIVKSQDISDAMGTPVADRSAWSMTGNIDVTGYNVMFDTDNSTAVDWSDSNPIEMVVNLGQTYTFDAIRAYVHVSYGSWWSYDDGSLPNGTEISVSDDGTTFNKIATVSADSWSNAEAVVFQANISARYVKIVIPTTSNWQGTSASFNCGDLNIYAQ